MRKNNNANWVAEVVEDTQLEAMGKLAGIFAAFYEGLVNSGLAEDISIQLTAAYIQSMVTNIIQAAQGTRPRGDE